MDIEKVSAIPDKAEFGSKKLGSKASDVTEILKKMRTGDIVKLPITTTYLVEEQKKEMLRWRCAIISAIKHLNIDKTFEFCSRGKDLFIECK